jgi:mannose-6-phosphate isomerase-like protein (cupin superfamily)
MTQTLEPLAICGGEGEARWWFGALAEIKATAADTGGQMTIVEVTEPPGMEAPLQVHHRDDEGFWILEGDVTFEVGDETIEASAGDYVFGPRDISRRFTVGDQGCRMLFILVPGGRHRGRHQGDQRARPKPHPPAATRRGADRGGDRAAEGGRQGTRLRAARLGRPPHASRGHDPNRPTPGDGVGRGCRSRQRSPLVPYGEVGRSGGRPPLARNAQADSPAPTTGAGVETAAGRTAPPARLTPGGCSRPERRAR